MTVWNPEPIEAAFAKAALNPTGWVSALDAVVSATGSYGALLIPAKGDGLPNIPFTESMSRSMQIYFDDGWHLRDERMLGVETMTRQGVCDDFDIIDPDRMKRHPYYQELLAPHRLRWFAGVRVASGDDIWCLAIQRTIEQGPFSETEKRHLAKLSSPLSASAALARAFSAATATGALQAFQVSGKAVVLINRRGEVIQANRCAEQLLVGDVRIERRKLVASDSGATAALNRSLHELMWRREAGGLSAPVLLPRRGQRPIVAYPLKIDRVAANALADCQALVILIDMEQQPRLPEAVLRSVFNLTAAEARLARQLAAGASLDDATNQIGIAKGTGRNQLKVIFMKTGVKRQSELVALLSSILSPTR